VSPIITSIITSVIGSAGSALGLMFASHKRSRHQERLQERAAIEAKTRNEDRHETHTRRLDEHDILHQKHLARFERLNQEFMPRVELQPTLDAIRTSSASTEDWVRFLVKREATEPK
jgi:hypothetical protein